MLDELAAGAFPIAPTWGVGAESLGEVVTESEGGPEELLRVVGAMAPRQLWGELTADNLYVRYSYQTW